MLKDKAVPSMKGKVDESESQAGILYHRNVCLVTR